MDKALISNKRVGPNKHVGSNFSKTLINVQFGSVYENPSKITIRNKKSWNQKLRNQNLL